ncbi:DUF4129 domain-containing protein [Pseudomonas baltica]|uniref:DUF4129 domain-containing protein n=1 Tax=Pseudomonas baltica TaxID=2762576 RepID=UPI0028A1CECE|nr:DUF4129 domain-containing protein [Pseudomonas baltica]
MQLNETTLVIRPRNPWEAIDLGVLLAARHWRLLLSSWAIATVPLFALLTLLLWDHPSIVIALIWWLKPAFERLPLHILAQSLFGAAPSVRQALRQWVRLLRPQLVASLTWRRLSLSRSFTLPVLQLEGLGGQQRLRRLAVLRRQNGGAARWLTLVGIHLELILSLGAVGLLYMLTPHAFSSFADQQLVLDAKYVEAPWLIHLRNAFYVVILLIWEPIYVACGFTLYLNRRTVLEAWDIELQFRRLRQRLTSGVGKTPALLATLAVLTALTNPSHEAWAQPVPLMTIPASTAPSQAAAPTPLNPTPLTTVPLPPSPLAPADTVAGPQSPRLLHQALTSEVARQTAQSIVQAPPFKNMQTVNRWRWKSDDNNDTHLPAATLTPHLPVWPQRLAKVVEVLLWGLLLALAILLVWRRREWLATLVSRLQAGRKPRPVASLVQHQAIVSDSVLPLDIAATAEQLWASQPREALSLLYRGLLSRLQTDHHLLLRSADTEGQVLAQVVRLRQPALEDFSRRLTQHWQALAYGHRPVTIIQQQQLLADWRALFDKPSHDKKVQA